LAGILRVPRSRGALSGTLLVLLGAWGALIAFIGPYFHYAFTPDRTWAYTSGRLWLEVLPGAAAALGGLIVLVAATRPTAVFGAWIAALSGAWFVVGRPLSTLWTTGATVAVGHPVGGHITRAVEDIGFFTGLGAVIVFFAAMALGRFTVVGAREAAHAASADKRAAAAETTATDTPAPAGTGPFRRRTRPVVTTPATTAAPATSGAGRWNLTGRLPKLPRRRPDGPVTDRPAGMTASQPAPEPAGQRSSRGSDTPS